MPAADRDDDDAPEQPLRCPRCNDHTLRKKQHASIEVDICERCKGIWLDRGELDAVLNLALVAEGYRDDLHDDGDATLVPRPRRRR